MNSIVYVGMDVRKESYTLCCYSFDKDKLQYQQKIEPDYKKSFKISGTGKKSLFG